MNSYRGILRAVFLLLIGNYPKYDGNRPRNGFGGGILLK